jgi:hypothetical protein
MPRFRITFQAAVEYEADPENYPSNVPTEMLALDLQGAHNDPYLTMDGDNTIWDIKGEIVKS